MLSCSPAEAQAKRRRAAAARQRRVRQRRKAGLACFEIEVSEHEIAEALILSGRLTEAEALRRTLIERELGVLVEDFIERWCPRHA